MQHNTKDNTRNKVYLTIVNTLMIAGIALIAGFLAAKIEINIWVAWIAFLILVLVDLWCNVWLLPEMAIVPSGGKAPISGWRVAAGFCFIFLIWGFVIFAVGNINSILSPFSHVGQAVIGIGIFVVLPAGLGIYFIKKDYKLRGILELSVARVLLLSLLIIIQVFVVICLGVLASKLDMINNCNPYHVFGGESCPSPDIYNTLFIIALVIAVTLCILQFVLFLLRKLWP